MKTKSIKQTVTFNASPEMIYNLIMDEKKHAAFTGSKATVSTKPDGRFTVFDGYCHGYNIELVEGKRIVQAWHFAEDGWPDGWMERVLLECDQNIFKVGTGNLITKNFFEQFCCPGQRILTDF